MPVYVRPSAIITPSIQRVLDEIVPHTGDVLVTVTSGFRGPSAQLQVIATYAKLNNVSFHGFDPGDPHKRITLPEHGREVYAWQPTWSRLLHLGVIINPPLAAECLEDYIRPSGENMKGKIIAGSPHGTGNDFDCRLDPGVPDVLDRAKAAGAHIRYFLVERKNNALHVACAAMEG